MNLKRLREINAVLPKYDVEAVIRATKDAPIWLHFGAGNIFRGYVASLAQKLLNGGLLDRGIIAAETFDGEIVDKVFLPYNNLVMNVTLGADGGMERELLASITESVNADKPGGLTRLAEIFTAPSLQIVSLTITEKGYMVRDPDGKLNHTLSIITDLLHKRYMAGKLPVALISMDNCSKNGELLCTGILELAKLHRADDGFINYLNDKDTVSFPWSMIDKITPRPDENVREYLEDNGIKDMEIVVTSKGTYIAPFVNAEKPEYLVIENNFPNGRPPFEHAGVYITDRDTVNKAERMKVATCLNPLHTAMAVIGSLLGYTKISDEMKDPEIVALIKRLGYTEGLPVVTNPGIISPREFIDEVINERLLNPFLRDSPDRITTDTSQKVGVRFGETIKSYINEKRGLDGLIAIPLAIAGWFRYLIGVADCGEVMEIAPDPLLEELRSRLAGIVWNEPESGKGKIKSILGDASIWGLDLQKTDLSSRIEGYFVSMLGGAGAVRETLKRELS